MAAQISFLSNYEQFASLFERIEKSGFRIYYAGPSRNDIGALLDPLKSIDEARLDEFGQYFLFKDGVTISESDTFGSPDNAGAIWHRIVEDDKEFAVLLAGPNISLDIDRKYDGSLGYRSYYRFSRVWTPPSPTLQNFYRRTSAFIRRHSTTFNVGKNRWFVM